MGRVEHIISVFVASPSDVADERNRLEQAIAELNASWSKELGVRLELVRWETHAYPGFGTDAQDVVNQAIPTDYDIFVGIMWCRFGTRTARAGSGTEEEFIRAKTKHDSDPASMKLMMYFKTAPISPRDMDPKQLEAVESFRQSLGEQGALWWDFNDSDEFEKLVRIHLTRQVQAWKYAIQEDQATPSRLAGADVAIGGETEQLPEEDELGLFDLADIYESRFAQLTEIAERITEATEEIGLEIQKRADELNAIAHGPRDSLFRAKVKKIIGKSASDMNQYANRIEAEVPLFRDALNEGMEKLITTVELSVKHGMQEKKEDVEEAIRQSHHLQDTIRISSESIRTFRRSADDLPPMTQELNRAKRRIVKSLDELLSVFGKAMNLVHEAEISITKLLEKKNGD
jgi:hypothetical protein